MRKICFAFLSATILIACQKEADITDPGGGGTGGGTGGGSTTGLLTRTVQVSGSDSIIADYAYDAAKRLVSFGGSASNGSFSITYRIVRNASGIITQTVAKSPQFASSGIDSLVTNFVYNTGTSRYTHSRYDLLLAGVPYSDSTVFSYDASGNLTRASAYSKISFIPYAPVSRLDYTYAGGNVATQKVYDYDATTSTYNLDETATFAYDAKTTPLKLGVEALILNMPTTFGNNNAVSENYVDATDPANNFSRTNTYTYNTAGKPSGGTSVENPGATSYTLRFYYN